MANLSEFPPVINGPLTAAELAAVITGVAEKTVPVDADMVPITDSAVGNSLKRLSWANIKATLTTFFSTLFQPLDTDLTDIAALTPANDDFLQRKTGAWTNRSVVQVQTDLGITSSAFAEQAQDAVGAMIDGSLTYVDATPLLQRSALTGDVTAPAGSNTTTIIRAFIASGLFDSFFRVGSMELQSIASVNNVILTDNLYYNEPNWRYRAAGSGVAIHLVAGGFAFRTAPVGAAGAIATMTEAATILSTGITALNLSGINSGNETAATIGNLIEGAVSKATPISTDLLALSDAAASGDVKKITWAQVLAAVIAGLGTMAVQNANAVAITGGSVALAANGTDSNFKIGSGEIQSFSAVNSLLFTDNLYHDGTNYRYRANGFGLALHLVAGGFAFRRAPSGVAGAIATTTEIVTISSAGITALNLLGTNSGDNAPNTLYSGLVSNATHTGDVTGATVLTIANGAVSLLKMADLAANSIIGNNTGSAATPIALSTAQVRSLLALGTMATQNANAVAITGGSVALAANGTDSNFKVGGGEIQGYALNSVLFMDNLYYDGTNYRYRANGFGVVLHMVAGGFAFRRAASGVAGAIATTTEVATIGSSGLVASGITGTKAQFDTACSDGNFLYVGDALAPRTLFDHFADVTTVGTSEETFYTETIAANTLAVNGAKILAKYSGILDVTNVASIVNILFAGTQIFASDDFAALVADGVDWELELYIIRVSNTTVRCAVKFASPTFPAAVKYSQITALALATTAYDLLFKVQTNVAGDFTAKMGYVEYKPAV